MKRKCPFCGKEYSLTQLDFDKGACPECPRPIPFLSLNCADPSPKGTRAVWKSVVFLHLAGTTLCAVLLGQVLCDTRFLSVPLVVYTSTVLVYFAVRATVAEFKGYPVLTSFQKTALVLLPFYGLPLEFVFFYLGQEIRYG